MNVDPAHLLLGCGQPRAPRPPCEPGHLLAPVTPPGEHSETGFRRVYQLWRTDAIDSVLNI